MTALQIDADRDLAGRRMPEPGGRGTIVLPAELGPPTLGHAPVHRPRALGQVTRGSTPPPLPLISAPAGAGKTVLAASCLRQQAERRPVAWLTVEDEDDEPRRSGCAGRSSTRRRR